MKNKLFIALCVTLIGLLAAACQSTQPAVVSESQTEVEVTRLVEVEVTRLVEVESNDQLPIVYSGDFPRLPFDTVMPTGQSVAVECQEDGGDYPYIPYDWPDASATLEIRQGAGRSTVSIEISNGRPDTYHTMWLRLMGSDANENVYDPNPLMGIPGTPLLPSSELPSALNAVSTPTDEAPNGFYTDSSGNASFFIELDFPIVDGAYPFDRYPDFDAGDERFKAENPSNKPVAIAGKGEAPFTLRVASHCVDGLGHGLLPGPHEGWFDWSME